MEPVNPPDPLDPIFFQYRRKLPHWRLTGATYFLTWKVKAGQPPLSESERDRVVSALWHFDGDRYELFVFVVMNDHVHVLVKPKDGHRLEAILHSWKSFTAAGFQKHDGRIGAAWQDETFDRIVRDDDEFWRHAAYIMGNPRRRWPKIQKYRWVWPDPEEADSLRMNIEDSEDGGPN